ncbi:MAG: hypothetical protein V4603_11095 [Pseudomonadota bacterium]
MRAVLKSSLLKSSIIAVLATTTLLSVEAQAQFKPKFYPECYTALDEARTLVPKPPMDIAKGLGSATKVAGIASSIGGLAGFGGFGGSTLKAAQTINTVNQYSGLVADVQAFTSAMQTEFPDLGLRLSAYGTQLGSDTDLLTQASDKVATGQQCYRTAYETLAMASVSGELKERDVKKQHEEITKGMAFAAEILTDAQGRSSINVKSYNEMLQLETGNAGIDLGGLLSLAQSSGVAPSASSALDLTKVTGDYETLGRVSALSALLGPNASIPNQVATTGTATVDPAVLKGLVDAGATSSRYLAINQQLGAAMVQQGELAMYLGKVPLSK